MSASSRCQPCTVSCCVIFVPHFLLLGLLLSALYFFHLYLYSLWGPMQASPQHVSSFLFFFQRRILGFFYSRKSIWSGSLWGKGGEALEEGRWNGYGWNLGLEGNWWSISEHTRAREFCSCFPLRSNYLSLLFFYLWICCFSKSYLLDR